MVNKDNGMLTAEQLESVSEYFKAFSDPTRLKILYLLAGETNLDVGTIASRLEMTDSAISHQLKKLKQTRLIASERKGKFVLYRLDDDHIGTTLMQAVEHISE